MKELRGKVALVTGAASGIGLALATRFAQEGMKVVLADIENGPLEEARAAIAAKGAQAMAVRADVMREEDVERLANAAFDTWGNVHVLCNNAGVGGDSAGAGIWNLPMEDWDWVLGVNFRGVLHGIRQFVPRMLAKGEAGHVVNTASAGGLAIGPTNAAYTVSKFGIVALSEILYRDLKLRNAKLSVSVVCPGWVNTKLADSARNRPEALMPKGAADPETAARKQKWLETVRGLLRSGLQPEAIAGLVLDAVQNDTFYVVPAQPDVENAVALRMEDIRLRRNPTITPPKQG